MPMALPFGGNWLCEVAIIWDVWKNCWGKLFPFWILSFRLSQLHVMFQSYFIVNRSLKLKTRPGVKWLQRELLFGLFSAFTCCSLLRERRCELTKSIILLIQTKKLWDPPKNTHSPLKNGGWESILSFWDALFFRSWIVVGFKSWG